MGDKVNLPQELRVARNVHTSLGPAYRAQGRAQARPADGAVGTPPRTARPPAKHPLLMPGPTTKQRIARADSQALPLDLHFHPSRQSTHASPPPRVPADLPDGCQRHSACSANHPRVRVAACDWAPRSPAYLTARHLVPTRCAAPEKDAASRPRLRSIGDANRQRLAAYQNEISAQFGMLVPDAADSAAEQRPPPPRPIDTASARCLPQTCHHGETVGFQ